MAEFYRDDERPAPGTVVAAVACGTTPVPFLAVYAVLFLVHGSVHPVVPPDITDSTSGEFVAGVIATVLFVACCVSLIWAISGRRRWPFASVQLLMFVVALYFLIDATVGGEFVSALVAVITAVALILIFWSSSWPFYGDARLPTFRRKGARARGGHAAGESDTLPAGSAPVSDAVPATSRVAGRPRPASVSDEFSDGPHR